MNATSDIPIGTSMAAVAVLLIQAERNAASTPYATRILPGRAPTIFQDSTPCAIRSLTRCTKSACARMKLPMNKKINGWAIGANASPAGATRNITARVGPSSAVTASGKASVTQKMMTRVSTAANRCASGDRLSIGKTRTTTNAIGPRTRPVLWRRCSKLVVLPPEAVSGLRCGAVIDARQASRIPRMRS